MKKIKFLLIGLILFSLTGCFNNDSMDNINIVTSVYPVEYVVNQLYGKHSTINSIYPSDTEIIDYEVTDVLLSNYSDNELFIFNGLSNEKNYVKTLLKSNKDLKIIDVTSNMITNESMEELWLDPNNLLTIANNIKTGFSEYIKSSYLTNEINDNYDKLKIELTTLDGKYYSAAKKASNTSIIISDNAFKYLEKYGLTVISLDPDTITTKDINDAKALLSSGKCNYIFIKYGEKINDDVNKIIDSANASTIELYTMTNLYNVNTEKSNYITLMNQNLDTLKKELYK